MEQAKHSHPNYIGIFVMLAVLTAGELGVAFLGHWPKMLIILILVGLAVWKALLVALYYMHLKFEKWNLRMLAIVPIPLALILLFAGMSESIW